MPHRLVVALLALAVASPGGCGGAGGSAVCPDDVIDACPSVGPTFAVDAAPVIQGHCMKCHTPGGPAQKYPFETYAQIFPFAGDMKLMLETCQMPPSSEPTLTADERRKLFGWIACGPLDN